jgi:hypothetical protein
VLCLAGTQIKFKAHTVSAFRQSPADNKHTHGVSVGLPSAPSQTPSCPPHLAAWSAPTAWPRPTWTPAPVSGTTMVWKGTQKICSYTPYAC